MRDRLLAGLRTTEKALETGEPVPVTKHGGRSAWERLRGKVEQEGSEDVIFGGDCPRYFRPRPPRSPLAAARDRVRAAPGVLGNGPIAEGVTAPEPDEEIDFGWAALVRAWPWGRRSSSRSGYPTCSSTAAWARVKMPR
jgi:hypothetical protein